MHKVKFLIFLVVLLNLLKGLRSYVIPNANLEILTDGFRVSIPDDKDVKIVAFNINRNRPFENYLEGEFSQKLREPANKLWTFEKTGIQLHNNDLIYIWIHVQVGNTAFRRIMHPVTVGNVKNVENMENGETSAAAAGAGAGAGAVCEASITRASNQRQPPCSGQLLFEENFIGDALRGENWRNEVYIPVDTPTGDNEFVYYDSATVAVADGHLKITPTLLSGEPQFLDLMDRCTAVDERERSCKRDWRNRILNIVPVASGRISTRGHFSFTYGRVEIRAKLPIGDWLYPLLLLEPLINHYGRDPYLSGQMRVAFARGNERLHHADLPIDGQTLYGGAKLLHGIFLHERYMANITKERHFGEDFHTYSLIWDDREITVKLDGVEYGSFRGGFADAHSSSIWKMGGLMAPLDQEFYITIGVAAGGFSAFPNVVTPTKPWKNTSPRAVHDFWRNRDTWLATWRSPSLEVDYVRVYAI